MVQILPEDTRARDLAHSLTSPFVQALMAGTQQRSQDDFSMKKMQEQSALERALLEQKFGHENALQKQKYEFEGQLEGKKRGLEKFEDTESLKDVENTFGPTFAKIYKAAPVGGRTELIKNAIDAKQRKVDLEQVLAPYKNQDLTPEAPKEEKEYPNINEFEGLNNKEKFELKNKFRGENKDIFQDVTAKSSAYDSEARLLNILDDLNPKLGDDLGSRAMINPTTNEPWGLLSLVGVVSPDMQRFVKTVNDFTTKAKDSFGARVTNFDLERFMSRLPSLMNTQEGRRQIIEQMKYINQINSLYSKELKKTYQHYKLGNISQENAEELTEKRIGPKLKELEEKLYSISSENTESSGAQNMRMIGPNGESYNIPAEHVEAAKSKGFKPA